MREVVLDNTTDHYCAGHTPKTIVMAGSPVRLVRDDDNDRRRRRPEQFDKGRAGEVLYCIVEVGVGGILATRVMAQKESAATGSA